MSATSLTIAVADAPGVLRTFHDGDVRRVELGNRRISKYNSTFAALGFSIAMVPGIIAGGNVVEDGGSASAALGTVAGSMAVGALLGASVDRHTTKTVYEYVAEVP